MVRELCDDESAEPRLSLLAVTDDKALGHIMFSKVHLDPPSEKGSFVFLAPLGVLPEAQRQGIGAELVEQGVKRLTQSGVDLVFVLGNAGFTSQHGFKPALEVGFEPPYPISVTHSNSWRVRELTPGFLGSVKGRVVCADAINKPEYWQE
jgi:putative acetyltransferase